MSDEQKVYELATHLAIHAETEKKHTFSTAHITVKQKGIIYLRTKRPKNTGNYFFNDANRSKKG